MRTLRFARNRAARPDFTFSADIIVGFPGEGEEDYRLTEDFCREAGFLHLHIFPFSKREGTEAASMDGQIPEPVKRERAERLELAGAEIRRDLLARYAAEHRDKPVHLLVEKNGGGFLSGHSEHFVELKKIPGGRSKRGKAAQRRLPEIPERGHEKNPDAEVRVFSLL